LFRNFVIVNEYAQTKKVNGQRNIILCDISIRNDYLLSNVVVIYNISLEKVAK
jgi:hypothetical protein